MADVVAVEELVSVVVKVVDVVGVVEAVVELVCVEVRLVEVVGVVVGLLDDADGGTSLAALRTYARLCAHPANSGLMVRSGALLQLCGLPASGISAEGAVAAIEGVVSLCTHANLSLAAIEQAGLLPLLLSYASGRNLPSRAVGPQQV